MTRRPSHAATIAALRVTDPRFSWVGPTEDEATVADVLALVEQEHPPTADEPDSTGAWGSCTGCGTRWPCERWAWSEHLAVQFLGRAADRVYTNAAQVMDGMKSRRSA